MSLRCGIIWDFFSYFIYLCNVWIVCTDTDFFSKHKGRKTMKTYFKMPGWGREEKKKAMIMVLTAARS